MSAAFETVLLALLLFLLLPTGVLLLQVVFALGPRRAALLPEGSRPRLAVLVPAHNEASGIRATLDSVRQQLQPGDRLLVVADNCSDGTALVARSTGVEVVERHDPLLRGKGYALDCGVRHLERDPPEFVAVVDADCMLAAGTMERLVRVSALTGRPVQALDLMKSTASAGNMMRIAEFAWIVKNLVRPLGYLNLGLPCQLMGTGMVIPWPAIRSAQLASGHIVEDMKMGIDFARAGIPPLFCPEALVVSNFPASDNAARGQRTRWEHGHLAMMSSEMPRLIADCIRGRGKGLLPLALDMCVPPLALLALVIVVLTMMSAAFAAVTSQFAPLALAGLTAMMFGIAVGLSWWRFGSAVISFWQLLLAVAYVPRKLPLYIGFLVRRQVNWVRAKRDGE